MDRREFLKAGFAFAVLNGIDPRLYAQQQQADPKRLSWLAYRGAGREGAWTLTEIEGQVPKALNGTLYRTAPGQHENHGVALKHIFDGDTFMMGFSFREGRVDFRARFLPLPERLQELEAGRMLYSEVGTLAPPHEDDLPSPLPRGMQIKHQPSVNVLHWDGRLLGFSDSNFPAAIDPTDFSYQGRWDFYGELGMMQSFTAHPRLGAEGEVAYAYGQQYNLQFEVELVVWRMELDGTLTELHRLPLDRPWFLHDMVVTENYIVIPFMSAAIHFWEVMDSSRPVTDTIQFLEDEPMRLLVLSKHEAGKPRWVELDPAVTFHQGNAFERDGKIVMETCLSADGRIFEGLASFADPGVPEMSFPALMRLVFDPKTGVCSERRPLGSSQEFPRYDLRRTGRPARSLYTVGGDDLIDPFAGTSLIRHDMKQDRAIKIRAGRRRVFGEPVFVPDPDRETEDAGWILALGYDADRDRTFLDIREAETMDLEARVWTPDHYPLGFHGNFTTRAFVKVRIRPLASP